MNRTFHAAFLLVLVALCNLARADGLIVIADGPAVAGHFPFAPLEVTFHRVDAEIDDPVAITRVDQEFYNPNGRRLEGTYIFPLPAGAHIDKFTMDIDGKQVEAEMLSADAARTIYEDIVRKTRDPALLEYSGRGALKCRIFPIEPNSKKRIKLQYTQVLQPDGGIVEYTYPLNTEKFSSKPLHEVAVKVAVACKQPLKSIYSPSHTVEIKRDGDRRAIVGYEAREVRPDTDFKLIFSRNDNPLGVDLLTYSTGQNEGYFLLLASPGVGSPTTTKVQQRDICFVLDTSGSMANGKLDQAQKALRFCLANLNDGDRFNIVRFSSEAEKMFNELRPVSKDNLAAAEKFIADLKPIGGTAIDDALRTALRQQDNSPSANPFLMIFLTDGQPTVGATDEETIVHSISASSHPTRIFPFGIGSDVNTHLLDRIAAETKAFSQYVLANEDLEVKLSSFYSKIKEPVLANVAIDFNGDVKTSQVYPAAMPDLFKGETLTIFGKFSGLSGGAQLRGSSVTITGTINGEKKTFSYDLDFTKSNSSNNYIPRLWATRRVGWLLDEIRLHGDSLELKDEVVRLAREHGIVTPYTSYLIIDEENRRRVPLAMQTMREMKADAAVTENARGYYRSAANNSDKLEKSGERAVANAQVAQQLQQAMSAPQTASGLALSKSVATTQPGYRFAQNYAQQVRSVAGKTFYQNGQTWSDADLQAKQNLKRQPIKFNSDEYFTLLKKHPNMPAWFSLGSEVDVVVDDTIYEIR